ncbi:polymorphic toxin-type HINT domain-containing protein [Streptomyces sp. NPDC002133]|uniref:polymorphic toxin-type HINT domain-containing protein n=1 Tax=Streptomyces sp. NPDC002133 TaxID=3154409 RepID=UPI0033331DE8
MSPLGVVRRVRRQVRLRVPRTEARLLGLRRRRRGRDRGQGALEYLGLVLVVVAIVGALVGTGIGAELTQKIAAQVSCIGGGECGGDDAQADGTGGTQSDPASDDGGDADAPKSQEQIDYEKALKELQDAQAAEKSDSDKAKEAAKELAKILAEELGIKDAFDCITKGDMGACTETLINILTSLIGGAVGKLAAKYGAPWKWKKAAELIKKLKKHGGDLYDGIKGLIKNRKKVQEAEKKLADAKKKLDAEKKDPPKKKDSCPTHSFLPGTPVLLADGTRIPIETVRIGDRVLATDPERGRTEARVVTDTISTADDKQFTRLTVSQGGRATTLTATDTHPFWVVGEERWVDAGDIDVGDELRSSTGRSLSVIGISRYLKQQRTHDLTVESIHTYYVGAGSTGVLVHNQDPTECEKKKKREEQEHKRMKKRIQKIIDDAKSGKFKKKVDKNPKYSYHGRLTDEKVLDILSNPEGIYISQGTEGRIIFYKDGNVVFLDGKGATIGQAVTAYGKDGPRGSSGAEIFGGKASDPGIPITAEMIEQGKMRTKNGYAARAIKFIM